MTHRLLRIAVLGAIALAGAGAALGQGRPDTAALLAAQREAMAPLEAMNGTWRGTAWTLLPSGEKHTVTQTERMGPFLQGSVKVIEGRGHEPDGRVSFNALGVISFDPATRRYNFRAYAQGLVGDFAFRPTADGYTWEVPAGQGTIRYVAVIQNATLREVGDRLMPGQEPVRFFEMNLVRVADSDWPAAGAVAPR
jgi:hypothetical protein